MASLWAWRARRGKVVRKQSPGTVVWTWPVALRTLAGASGFGSHVSAWLGPPCIIRRITDFPVVKERSGPAPPDALPAKRTGMLRPARLPTVRKPRWNPCCGDRRT